MDREIKKKDELIDELIKQFKEFVNPYQVGGANYEEAQPLAEELAKLCEMETEYVAIEECPMASSGFMLKECEIKVKE